MIVSIGKTKSTFKPKTINTMSELSELILNDTYSLATYKENYRRADHFEIAEAFGLDFDDGLSLDQALIEFKDYKHIIATTRNHQKEKGGITADRFRVILFLSKPITSRVVFKNTVKAMMKKYPQSDRQCSDAARMFYKSTKVMSVSDTGKTVDPSAPIKIVTPTETTIDFSKKPDGFTNCKWAIANGHFKAGEGNEALMSPATHCKGLGYTKEMTYYVCKNAVEMRYSLNGAEFDKETVWREIIEYVYSPSLTVKYNCKTEDTWLHDYCEDLGENKCHQSAKNTFNIKHIGEFYKEKHQVNWFVNNLLTEGSCSILAGPPKSGKSTLIRQLIKATASGTYFLGRKVKKGPVLYLALEEHEGMIQSQLQKVGITKKDDVYLHVGSVNTQTAAADLEEIILQTQPSLVIVDTLGNMFNVGDMNSYGEVGSVFVKYRDIARKTGAHIVFIHHSTKGEGTGGAILGSVAFAGGTDCNITFRVDHGGERSISAQGRGIIPFNKQKLKYDADLDTYSLNGKEYHDEF